MNPTFELGQKQRKANQVMVYKKGENGPRRGGTEK